MENNILVISKKTRDMVKANLYGLMEENTLVDGFVESKVEKASTKITMDRCVEESGLMERDKNGLKIERN